MAPTPRHVKSPELELLNPQLLLLPTMSITYSARSCWLKRVRISKTLQSSSNDGPSCDPFCFFRALHFPRYVFNQPFHCIEPPDRNCARVQASTSSFERNSTGTSGHHTRLRGRKHRITPKTIAAPRPGPQCNKRCREAGSGNPTMRAVIWASLVCKSFNA